jgi:hypothetical protein
MLNPLADDYVTVDPAEPARLIVVVDTEEEFDWSAGRSRQNTSVRAMQSIGRLQTVFEEYRITPVYVVDYPVAAQPEGYEPLRDILHDGRCVIGAHLHPWVNPPFTEPVSSRTSFPGNLAPDVEGTKLQILGELIGERFGTAPTIYKAGRYGLGPNTAAILEEQGYEADLSVCPRMDYSREAGPDFSAFSACPYWFGRRRRLLELPLTIGFSGVLRRWGPTIHRVLSRPGMARTRAIGVCARLRLLDKIWLSPEGFRTDELRRLGRALWQDGQRIFSFALHSPSAEPGHTPYVRSTLELGDFLARCRRVFDLLVGELGAQPSTPLTLKRQLSDSFGRTPVEAP